MDTLVEIHAELFEDMMAGIVIDTVSSSKTRVLLAGLIQAAAEDIGTDPVELVEDLRFWFLMKANEEDKHGED